MKTLPIVLITGASKGIGASLALLLSENYRVILNYRQDEASAEKISSAIKEKGGQVLKYKADISNEGQVRQMFDHVKTNLGAVSHVINNAGILGKLSDFMSMDDDRIKNTFATNVYGTIHIARYAIPQLKSHPLEANKSMVNISTGAVKFGAPHEYIDYAMSKGAIEVFTVGLAKELAPFNIRVNTVRPGFVDTGIHENKEERLKKMRQSIPLARIGYPSEVANGIEWLISDKASYVTGTIMEITGGR